MQFFEVAVHAGAGLPARAGANLSGVYTYQAEALNEIDVGWLVLVPFGARMVPGIVVAMQSQGPGFETRRIEQVLSDRPFVSRRGIQLARFISATYRAPFFECLLLLLPPGFSARLPRGVRDGKVTPPNFRTPRAEEAALAAVSPSPRLTADQLAACDEITSALRQRQFKPFLLEGVTGSGKTLLYTEAVAAAVEAGLQAIILVSEIGLTPELLARFRQRFPGVTAELHSGMSPAARYRAWQDVAENRAKVIVGARSAIFAPAAGLGLIVLDEEHEWTFKQDDVPRYHARAVALELGRLASIPVVLSSATPDVSSSWRARNGELSRLRLSSRYSPSPESDAAKQLNRLPTVEVVDLRQELRNGNTTIFSNALRDRLGESLERNEQAILFINRRGAATCVSCRFCGHVVSCRRCEAPMIYHHADGLLICHRCNRRREAPSVCPICDSQAIRHFGVGTQRVEQELIASFPAARVVRWDRDTNKKRGAADQIWRQFRAGEANVLVGTQLVAKALDFPLVTMVGVVLADVGLNLPDFRATERSFQVLTQVAGRAGRAERAGSVVIQTYSPDRYAVQLAARHDYDAFYEREIGFRRAHGYPPFGRLVRLLYRGSDAERCNRETERLRQMLADRIAFLADPELRIIGPAPCYVERVRGRWRWQIIVRGQTLEPLLDNLVLPPGWIIDVDPETLL